MAERRHVLGKWRAASNGAGRDLFSTLSWLSKDGRMVEVDFSAICAPRREVAEARLDRNSSYNFLASFDDNGTTKNGNSPVNGTKSSLPMHMRNGHVGMLMTFDL